MLSPEYLGRPGKCLVLGRPSRSCRRQINALVSTFIAGTCLPARSQSVPHLFFSSTAHNPLPDPTVPRCLSSLAIVSEAHVVECLGVGLLEGRERFEMMSLEDRVSSRCAITPRTPQLPPATGRPACAGSRFRGSWYAV